MDPSMNTEPESSIYQLVASSPVLKVIITYYLCSLRFAEMLMLHQV